MTITPQTKKRVFWGSFAILLLFFVSAPFVFSAGDVSGTIFRDTDGNGSHGGGESGIENVTIQIWNDNDSSGTITAGDTVADGDRTDANGDFSINVADGDYVLHVTDAMTNAAPGSMSVATSTLALTVSGSAVSGKDIGFFNATTTNAALLQTAVINRFVTNGPDVGDRDGYGTATVNLGDLNGDGVNDILVGEPENDDLGEDAGRIHFSFLNTDASIDSTVEMTSFQFGDPSVSTGDMFGFAIASLGDLDGDGVQDIIVGSPGDDHGGSSRGVVQIVYLNTTALPDSSVEINDSSANGPVLADGDEYGSAIANLGDLDGDGVNDIAVGAPGDGEGVVHISFLNTTGTVKSTVEINSSTANGPTLSDGDGFGRAITNIGDIDGDGVEDIAVGAYLDDTGGSQTGAVYIIRLNANGTVKSTTKIDSTTINGPDIDAGDRYGISVENMRDLDGDGVNEIAVGAFMGGAGTQQGVVHISFMNTDGSIKKTVEINSATTNGPTINDSSRYGYSIAHMGDLNGDGIPEMAVGQDAVCSGSCIAFSAVQVSYLSFDANAVPSLIVSTPSQASSTAVSVSATIADVDPNVTSLEVFYSFDQTSWTSSSILSASQNGEGDGVVTSSGFISDIDTDNDGSVNLTLDWNIGVDIPNTDTSTAYMRFVASDGTATTTAQTSAFSIDTQQPSAPGALTVSEAASSTATLDLGATSTDSNFESYRIFYALTASPATNGTSSLVHTSSSDANLANQNFTGTTTVNGLSPNTLYYFEVFAYDTWGFRSSSGSTVNTTTLAAVPTNLTATSVSTTEISFSWSTSSNPSGTEYQIRETGGATTSAWITATTTTLSGLTCGNAYTFEVRARNADNIASAYSSTESASTTACPGTPGVNLSKTALSLTEGGNTDSYTIVMNNEVASDVTVTFGSLVDVSMSSSSLTFTNGNWNVAQTVTVTAVDDSTAEGTETVTITHTVTSVDSAYNGIGVNNVSVTITDNDHGCPGTCGGGGTDEPDPTGEGEEEEENEEDEEEPECAIDDPLCDETFVPTAGFYIAQNGMPKKFVHDPNVTLVFDVANADEVALVEVVEGETPNFSGLSFEALPDSMPWTLATDPNASFYHHVDDGKKCVHARFRNSANGAMTDSFACVVYDTYVRPPVLGHLESGVVDGVAQSAGYVHGTAEPYSTIVITKENVEQLDPSYGINITPVVSCTPVDRGIEIVRETAGGSFITSVLERNCRDAGRFGIRDYHMVCAGDTAYQTLYRACRVVERTFTYTGGLYANQIDPLTNVFVTGTEIAEDIPDSTNSDDGIVDEEEVPETFLASPASSVPQSVPPSTVLAQNTEGRHNVSATFQGMRVTMHAQTETYTPAPFVYLAGVKVTYTLEADENGDWYFSFPTGFDADLYEITMQEVDLAGNNSYAAPIELYTNPPEPVVCEGGICTACPSGNCGGQNECAGENPPAWCPSEDLCFTNPDLPECAEVEEDICDTDPQAEGCPETNVCEENPDAPECSEGEAVNQCDIDPTAPTCVEEESGPTFCEENPSHADCTGAPSFCELNPTTAVCLGADVEAPTEDEGPADDGGADPPNTDNEEENITSSSQAEDEEASLLSNIVGAIQTFIDNPTIETFTKNIAVPAVAVAAVANVSAAALQFPAIWNLLKYLFGQPFLLWRLKKRKKWGVVYNAFTKQPIPLATIRLLNTDSGKILQSQVTDFEGRFLLIAGKGTYRIEVDKPGYEKQSTYLKNQSEDHAYVKLYHGEDITVDEKDTNINYAIPLDPVDEIVSTTQLLKDHARRISHLTISLLGFGLGVAFFIVTPTPVVALTVLLHAVLFGIFYKISHVPLPGSVGTITDATSGARLSRTVVRIFDATYNRIVDSHITDRNGRYAALVGPSTYYVTYEKLGYEGKKSETLDFGSKGTNGQGGAITRSETLQKKQST